MTFTVAKRQQEQHTHALLYPNRKALGYRKKCFETEKLGNFTQNNN